MDAGLCGDCLGLRPLGDCCRDREQEGGPHRVPLQDRLALREPARSALLRKGVSVPCLNTACSRRTSRAHYCCQPCADAASGPLLMEVHTALCDFHAQLASQQASVSGA